MLKLLLMRHAKSSWKDPDLDDQERPLNGRGRENADAMGKWMAKRGIAPDVVITSSTVRSQETWRRVKDALGQDAPTIIADELYSSGPDRMLRTLHDAPKGAKTVLMIGHQPAISSFARKLANGSTPSSCKRAYKKFPTAAVAVIAPKAKKWKDVSFGDADFEKFSVPKEVKDA